MAKYIAFIELEREMSSDFLGVVFPDFPGLVSAGDTYEEAYRNAHEALSGHVEAMKEHGEKIPKPSSLEKITAKWVDFKDWENTKYAIALIDLLPESKTQRYTISMDAQLMAEIDARTKNRSAFLAAAAKSVLAHNNERDTR